MPNFPARFWGGVDRTAVLSCMRFANDLGRVRVSEGPWPVPKWNSSRFRPCQEYDVRVVPSPDIHPPSLHRTWGISCKRLRADGRRVPLAVRVDLCSLNVRHPAKEALRKNQRARRARGFQSSMERERSPELVVLPGAFGLGAGVYCEPLGRRSYAMGCNCCLLGKMERFRAKPSS